MKTTNFIQTSNDGKNSSLNSFFKDALTIEDLFSIRGGQNDSESDTSSSSSSDDNDGHNGSDDDQQDDATF